MASIDVDIDIDEYLDEASTSALAAELAARAKGKNALCDIIGCDAINQITALIEAGRIEELCSYIAEAAGDLNAPLMYQYYCRNRPQEAA